MSRYVTTIEAARLVGIPRSRFSTVARQAIHRGEALRAPRETWPTSTTPLWDVEAVQTYFREYRRRGRYGHEDIGISINLPPDVHAALSEAASRESITVRQLARRILTRAAGLRAADRDECIEEGCSEPIYRRAHCQSHYNRLTRYGDTNSRSNRRNDLDDQQIIELRAGGLSWHKIADRLGVTATAVRRRHIRATLPEAQWPEWVRR